MKTYTTNSATQTYAKGFDTEVEKMEERNYFKGKTWNVLMAGIQILRGTRLAHPLPLSLPYEYSIMREKCTLLVSYLGSIVLPLAHFSV